jgi:hypothetical protein
MAGHGVYIYGICAAGAGPLPRGSGAVDPRFPLTVVEDDGLAALVSEVSLDEFAREELSLEQADDRAWLEAKVRAHEQTVERGLDLPLLPMRFGTVVADERDVRALLRARREMLHEALARVAGRREWGVKADADAELLVARVRESDPQLRALAAEADDSGHGFFAGKRLARETEQRVAEQTARLAERIHARVGTSAYQARVNPLPAAAAGRLPILNAAYLVDRNAEAQLRALVAEVSGELAAEGVTLTLTGPWPAYNFVSLEEQP